MTGRVGGWGPEQRRAALSITFDNLGEVAEEQLGLSPIRGDGGRHLSIEVMPELLKMLENTKITYFIEGRNCESYPETIKAIRDAGHEIAVHGWVHENWASTPVADRRKALRRASDAFRALGVEVEGFRPPGGAIELSELEPECLENSLTYSSPLGAVGDDRRLGEFVSLPFAWEHVDAYVLHPDLGALRQAYGDPATPFSADHWRATIETAIETVKSVGGHVTLIFHPFVLGRDRAYIDVLKWVADTAADDREIWAPTCAEMASWIRSSGLQKE